MKEKNSNYFVAGLIRASTCASSNSMTIGEVMKGRNSEGSQGSNHVRMADPVPTLHRILSLSTSLPIKMLLYVYEPN